MVDFTVEEKHTLLEAAESQKRLHTYLLGINGQAGFCKTVENKLGEVDVLRKRQTSLESRMNWVVGVLAGASVLIGVIVSHLLD